MTHSSNVNLQEIKNFESASADWWKVNGPFKTLHDINPLRLTFITQAVVLENQNIIDVGCGGGILAESLAKLGAKVTGIDAGEEVIRAANNHAASENLEINYLNKTAETFVQENSEKFDVLTCMELLEHVPDPASLVQACADLVKPGGHLFFSTIHRNLKSYAFAILGAEYLLKLLPKGIHTYEKFIRPLN